MANLYEILEGANGGDAIDILGRELGLTSDQAQAAVAALLPALSEGLKRSTETVEGLGNLGALLAQQKGLAELYDDAKLALSPDGLAAGRQDLAFAFGSTDVIQSIVDTAGKDSGVSASVLDKLLPALAGIAFSGLLRTSIEDRPLEAQGALSAFGGSSNPLGDILGQIFGKVLTGGATPVPPPAPSGGGGLGPLGDILGQIFGQGAGPSAGPAPAPSPSSYPSPSQFPAPADTGGQGGGFGGDILGTIFREVLKGIQNGTIKPVIIGGGGPIQFPVPGGQDGGGGSVSPQQVPGGDVFGQILKEILGGALGGGAGQGGATGQIPQLPQGGPTQAGPAPTPPLKDLSDLTKQLGIVGGAGSAVFGDQLEHGQDVDRSYVEKIQRIIDRGA